jgi:hypothetical protein
MRFLFALFLMLASSSLWSQDFLNLFSPELPSTSLDLEGLYLPRAESENNNDKVRVFHQAAGVNQKIFQDDLNYLSVGARYQKLDLSGKSALLNDYYNQQANFSYRRSLPDENFWLASLSFGSSSDKPFKESRDNTISGNYIQKLNSKWYGAINYSNNRAFLNNIPLPGFFYVKEMSRDRGLIIGFPFIFWNHPISESWSFKYIGILPWSHRLRFLYTKWRFVKPYAGFEQQPQNFFRHDRVDNENRIFWFERRAMIGVETGLSRSFRVDFATGYSFDRQFFEAKNFSQSKEFLINLENSYFVSLNLRYNL